MLMVIVFNIEVDQIKWQLVKVLDVHVKRDRERGKVRLGISMIKIAVQKWQPVKVDDVNGLPFSNCLFQHTPFLLHKIFKFLLHHFELYQGHFYTGERGASTNFSKVVL
jgi:hypothetical protein